MRIMRIAPALTVLCLVAGIVLLLAGSALALDVAGVACLAVGGVAAAELAFFAVGRSEDRERAEEAARRRR